MSFWKYFITNGKIWIRFFAAAHVFVFLAHVISPFNKPEWWGIEYVLFGISIVILIGDYIVWRKTFKK